MVMWSTKTDSIDPVFAMRFLLVNGSGRLPTKPKRPLGYLMMDI